MDNTNRTNSQLVVGLTGAVIGALGTAAILLSDEQTRNRAKKIAGDISDSMMRRSSMKADEFEKQKSKFEEIKKGIDEDTN